MSSMIYFAGDYIPCPYHALANPREFESNVVVGVVSQCGVGFEFNDTVCTCLKVAEGMSTYGFTHTRYEYASNMLYRQKCHSINAC